MASAFGDDERVRLSLGFLDALFERATIGLGVLDRELRYVRINSTLASMNGPSIEEHIGRRPREIIPDLAETLEPLCRRVLETGQPVVDHEVIGETPAHPGRRRHWQASYYPILEAGRAAGLGAIVVEVTERVRVREELEQQSLHIYDDVVQALTVAKMGLELGGQTDIVYATVTRALEAAKHLTSSLLTERKMQPPEQEGAST